MSGIGRMLEANEIVSFQVTFELTWDRTDIDVNGRQTRWKPLRESGHYGDLLNFVKFN